MADIIKLADYVAEYFAGLGIQHAFVVAGGASLHLIHGIEKTEGISHICCHHEQSAAMAADAYFRVTGKPGLAITSSGPGATNLLTGICGCFYDSVPAIFLTGQVARFRMSKDPQVRQIGFQETPTVAIFQSVTKYSVQILDPTQIRYELEKAHWLALEGRPGPVHIDIPDDIQREEINPSDLLPYIPSNKTKTASLLTIECKQIAEQLKLSKRPVVIAGWGIRLACANDSFIKWIEQIGVPVALTWAACDLLPFNHPLRIGTFGTHGTRFANYAVQNADLIISIGSRLDTKATGSPPNTFARCAWKAVVDISNAELSKYADYGLNIDLLVQADAAEFIYEMRQHHGRTSCDSWKVQISNWKESYNILLEDRVIGNFVNPYHLFDSLSDYISKDCNIWADTGSTIAWLMQAFRPQGNQRIWHDFNNTAMGWALPASIASALAEPDIDTLCIVGDGSLMMNIQELATIVSYNLPIKILCLDNQGYSMIQQTQDQWLDSNYVASSPSGGLEIPDLTKVASAFGFESTSICSDDNVADELVAFTARNGPQFLHVHIDPRCRVTPQVKYGRPNEDPEPLLERQQFFNDMIIPPHPTSL